jgi:hypothetical protein
MNSSPLTTEPMNELLFCKDARSHSVSKEEYSPNSALLSSTSVSDDNSDSPISQSELSSFSPVQQSPVPSAKPVQRTGHKAERTGQKAEHKVEKEEREPELFFRQPMAKPFRLSASFIDAYRQRKPKFGFNGFGELVYMRTYSRKKSDGVTNELWFESVERVINGTFTMLKRWKHQEGLPWNEEKETKRAQAMYELIFTMKFLPPGRGLYVMGSPIIEERGLAGALNNCGFCTTECIDQSPQQALRPFTWLMDASMLGIGVGFDTKGAGKLVVSGPDHTLPAEQFVIPDSRDGWVKALEKLLDSHFHHKAPMEFDYSLIRPAGVPLKAFGGVASGPAFLQELLQAVATILVRRSNFGRETDDTIKKRLDLIQQLHSTTTSSSAETEHLSPQQIFADLCWNQGVAWRGMQRDIVQQVANCKRCELELSHFHCPPEVPQEEAHTNRLTIEDIADIMNRIGKCVVAGNVRRSALIAFGDAESEEYLHLKNYDVNPQRAAFGWTSNNSILAPLGMDYSKICERIKDNGEPGVAWLHNMQQFSRMDSAHGDGKDWRVQGGNPCLEQSLEPFELCCLVETFPNHHSSKEDFLETLKSAFLYAKIVTLGTTTWAETNAVMKRNRRIGTSVSGIAQFLNSHSLHELRDWLTGGYSFLKALDKQYSEELAISESVKITSVKPSGTVSLLANSTPGIHYPESRFYIRRMRLSPNSELIAPLKEAGYSLIWSKNDSAWVVEVPVDVGAGIRTQSNVSLWEQLSLGAFMQKYWADNQVSQTVTFDPATEANQLEPALNYFQYQLKGVSFLPKLPKGAYDLMPYEEINEAEFNRRNAELRPLQLGQVQTNKNEQVIERFCDGDSCQLR